MTKRKNRQELAADIAEMERLRTEENKTYRQIADIMGYKSPGTVSDLLQRRGHFSVVFSGTEIDNLISILRSMPATKLVEGVLHKLTKQQRK